MSARIHYSVVLAVAGFACLMTSGCGGQGANPSTVRVTGTVSFNGSPLQQGTIIFYPSNGRPAYGKIVEGQIVEVSTFGEQDGVIVGEHKVAIQAIESDPDDAMASTSLIPSRYGDPEQSGLSAIVSADGTNNYQFELSDP